MNSLEDALRFLAPDETARAYLDRALAEPIASGIPWMDDDPEPALRAGNSSRSSARGVREDGTGDRDRGARRASASTGRRAVRGSEARVVVIDCDGKFDQCASCGR